MGVELELSFDGEGAIPGDFGLSLQLDFLRLQERRTTNDDFDCEEIDIRVDEAAILNMMVVAVKGEDVDWIYFYTKWEMPGLL